MKIVCQQIILMENHAIFVIFEKNAKFSNCGLLQIICGALRVNSFPASGKKFDQTVDSDQE